MRNALDEIDCIPTIGGQKPPYKIISHDYCVDIIKAYTQLSEIEYKEKKEQLNSLEKSIWYYCKFHSIDFDYHFKEKQPLTISPSASNFQWYLAMLLIGFDLYKINALLNFQKKRFSNEDVDFETFVEFPVYDIVKKWSKFDNSERLSKIMNWVDGQRKTSDSKTYFYEKAEPSIHKETIIKETIREIAVTPIKSKKGNNKEKIISPSFSFIGAKKNKKYFEEKDSILTEIFNLLQGGDLISKEITDEQFKFIFSGKEINKKKRLNWTGSLRTLSKFITLLMDNHKKVNRIDSKWETTTNCFTKDGAEITPLTKLRNTSGQEKVPLTVIELIEKL